MATYELDRLHECAIGKHPHKINGKCAFCHNEDLPWFAEYRVRVGYKAPRTYQISPAALGIRGDE